MKKSLKRLFAAGLTAAMVMSMGMTAMAAKAGTADGTNVMKDVNAVNFTKTYTLTGETTADILAITITLICYLCLFNKYLNNKVILNTNKTGE